MTRLTQVKTNFTAGEVSTRLLGRGDLRAYDNGALRLENLFIHPTGGVTRRAGLYHIDVLPGRGRLVPFEFNTEQTYDRHRRHRRLAGGGVLGGPWLAGIGGVSSGSSGDWRQP